MTKRVANEKINLLGDFCLLNKKDTKKVGAVKALLMGCTEFQAERLFRDIFNEVYTLDELLINRGLI